MGHGKHDTGNQGSMLQKIGIVVIGQP